MRESLIRPLTNAEIDCVGGGLVALVADYGSGDLAGEAWGGGGYEWESMDGEEYMEAGLPTLIYRGVTFVSGVITTLQTAYETYLLAGGTPFGEAGTRASEMDNGGTSYGIDTYNTVGAGFFVKQ